MEIQRIYSEIDTDEKLYSVLMNEEELALFSEIQKEFAVKPKLSRTYFKELGQNWKNITPLSEEQLVRAGRNLSKKNQLPRGINASINIKTPGNVRKNKKIIEATTEYPLLRFAKDSYFG